MCLVAKLCPTPCDPTNRSTPCYPALHYLLVCVSHSVVSDSLWVPWTVAHQVPPSVEFPGKNTRVGCHLLLQGIFWTPGTNPGLLHCRRMPYHLSYQGSHYLPQFAQTHVHWVHDAVQPPHPLLTPSFQSFPASGSFPVSWLFASGGQSSFNFSFSNEYSIGLISFRIDWFGLLAVQGSLKSLLQYHNLKYQFFGG